jgi:hypothetical protein
MLKTIAWPGSLAHNGYDKYVARISDNVLRRISLSSAFIAEPSV